MKQKIVIFGGTGFIGLGLAEAFSKQGYFPILIGRNEPKQNSEYQFVKWDAQNIDDWKLELEDAKTIINLAGKSVNCIKTPDNIDEILRSRVETTRLIGRAIKSIENPPKIWIQMSTAHIYGDSLKTVCNEDSATGYGIAPFVGKAWEEAFYESKPENCRGIVLRTSFVLGKNGGALKDLERIVKLGLGGKIGHGQQGISWIHQQDLNRIVLNAITNVKMNGVFNITAPNPVSNQNFMKILRRVLKVPFGIPSPIWILKFGAKFLFKTDYELAAYGRYVVSERLLKLGFQFQYEFLEDALNDIYKKKKFYTLTFKYY